MRLWTAILFGALLLAACGSSATAVPTPTPTPPFDGTITAVRLVSEYLEDAAVARARYGSVELRVEGTVDAVAQVLPFVPVVGLAGIGSVQVTCALPGGTTQQAAELLGLDITLVGVGTLFAGDVLLRECYVLLASGETIPEDPTSTPEPASTP